MSGTVRDDAGAPVAAASVFIGDIVRTGGTQRGFSTTTDATGAFHGVAPAGSYLLFVSKPGHEDLSGTVTVAGDTLLAFTLTVGVYIGGTITELGVGPLDDATVEVVSGSTAGSSTLSGHPIAGRYFLGHVRPGDVTVRASKVGYEPVEQLVHALVNVGDIDFTLKWAYGTCLRSVTPVSFDPYSSAGGTESFAVDAVAGRQWTVTPDSTWLQLLSPSPQTGSSRVTFRVSVNPVGATVSRRGAMQVRCGPSEGQNVWIIQNPACQIRLEAAPDSPAIFGRAGGTGHLLLNVSTPSCHWEFTSQSPWIRTNGISSWNGDLPGGIYFVVSANDTGASRGGTLVVGETVWQVQQQ